MPDRHSLVALPARHPVIAVAGKAALAAVLAWLVVQPWGVVADRYDYYAPLGAVVSVSTTLVQSVRATTQAAIAIGLGAALAVATHLSDLPQVVGLGIVVAVGSLAAAWPRLGTMGSWVPISALFVLMIGGEHPSLYVLGYLGLTTVGAAVGALVNAALPPLPLTSAITAQRSLRSALADQLEGLAEGIRAEPLSDPTDWVERARGIEEDTRRMQALVARAGEAQRANWRARGWADTSTRAADQGRALGTLAFAVQELTQLLAEAEHADRAEVALGPALRPAAADAICAVAGVLQSVEDGDEPDPDSHTGAHDAVEDFGRAVRERQQEVEGDYFAAGSLVVAMRRVLEGLQPRT
ncbi:hypothetical protein RDV89_11510 [Nocardioides zeae]|uniref:FUSC family protein n=1 Tax=Nocardioides imazamoxiresistens TaxID=3231893 RepID=A0ABU3PWT4_9ACTN|nr:hypothetical protein [Nocardioides zeae]MDT9593698.1 hypothetical protein [Nocardioides zeae]